MKYGATVEPASSASNPLTNPIGMTFAGVRGARNNPTDGNNNDSTGNFFDNVDEIFPT